MVYRRRYLSGQSATTVVIAEKAVTTDKISDKAVDTPQLADDAVISEKIADGQVKSEDIGTGEVKTADIANLSVTGSKIAESTIPESKLSFSVSARPLVPGVDTAEIQNLKVTAAKLAADAVEAAKIKDGAVSAAKLAVDAVETAKIKDDAVTAAKIAGGAVGNTEIAADAVRGTEIQDGAVSEGKVGTDAVTTVKIKDRNVTTPKIALLAVTPAELAADAVETLKINNLAVTTPKLGANAVILAKADPDLAFQLESEREVFSENFLGSVLNPLWRENGDAGGVAALQGVNGIRITTDNDINDFYRLDWNNVHGLKPNAGQGLCIIRAKPIETTNVVLFIGIFKDANNFVGFRLDTAVDNNWYAVSKQGGAETATSTGIAASVAFKEFKFKYLSVGGNIEFFIAGASLVTLATNQFTDVGHVCLKVETLGAATRSMEVSFAGASQNRDIES